MVGAGTAFVLCLSAMPATALTVIDPCIGVESGMYVTGAGVFGFPGSGFVVESYFNAYGPAPDGQDIEVALPGPVPALNDFAGYRVVDCASGTFLAIGGNADDLGNQQLAATAPLQGKIQHHQAFTLADVSRAADALYKGRDATILRLRETGQTCACKEYGGQ